MSNVKHNGKCAAYIAQSGHLSLEQATLESTANLYGKKFTALEDLKSQDHKQQEGKTTRYYDHSFLEELRQAAF